MDDEGDDEDRESSISDVAYKAKLVMQGSLDLAFGGIVDSTNVQGEGKKVTERQQKLREKLQAR